jgi:hypothetical protein
VIIRIHVENQAYTQFSVFEITHARGSSRDNHVSYFYHQPTP